MASQKKAMDALRRHKLADIQWSVVLEKYIAEAKSNKVSATTVDNMEY